MTPDEKVVPKDSLTIREDAAMAAFKKTVERTLKKFAPDHKPFLDED